MKYLIMFLLFTPLFTWSQTHFQKGEICFKGEKYEQAKIEFEQAQKEDSNNEKTIEYLGDIQCHLQHWDDAIPYYKKLIQWHPTTADYFYKYGGALAMKAKSSNKMNALLLVDDMKAAFEKAIQYNPNHIGARWALIELYIQVPGFLGGSEVKAQKYSNELLKISPVDGYLSKGHIEEYFKRYSNAEKQYLKAIEVGNSLTSYQQLASLYKNKMNQPEKAKQILAAYNEKKKS